MPHAAKVTAKSKWRNENDKMESRSRLASPGVRAGSVRGPFGTVRGPFGVRAESVRGSFGVRAGSVRGPFGIRSGFARGPFAGVRDPREVCSVHGSESVRIPSDKAVKSIFGENY